MTALSDLKRIFQGLKIRENAQSFGSGNHNSSERISKNKRAALLDYGVACLCGSYLGYVRNNPVLFFVAEGIKRDFGETMIRLRGAVGLDGHTGTVDPSIFYKDGVLRFFLHSQKSLLDALEECQRPECTVITAPFNQSGLVPLPEEMLYQRIKRSIYPRFLDRPSRATIVEAAYQTLRERPSYGFDSPRNGKYPVEQRHRLFELVSKELTTIGHSGSLQHCSTQRSVFP